MRSLMVFLKKLGFELPNNGDTSKVATLNQSVNPPSGSFLTVPLADWLNMNIVSQFDIIITRFSKNKKNYKRLKKFILNHNSFVLNKLNCSTIDFIEKKIKKANLNLKPDNKALVVKNIHDLYFYSYIFFNIKNRPEELTFLFHAVKKIELINIIDSYSEIVLLTEEEIKGIGKVVLNTSGKQISIISDDDIKKPILDKWDSVNEVIDFIVDFTDKDEGHIRSALSELLLNIKAEAQNHFNFMPLLMTDIFETLLPIAKSKQQVYSFMHSVFEPFYPSLHNEEEYWSQRDHSVREKKSFNQHQRDAIDSLKKVKNLKFFRT
ncbi:MAG: hypothetical protein ACI9JN_000153 [Bacteroidia bacterium]|jgi:hypothetical protein